MRTVILSAQAHNDLRKFGLCEVVPKLVRAKAWETAPRIWDGVLMFMKNFGGHREAETALRSLLGTKGAVLQGLLKVASNCKGAFSKLWKTLSKAERVEVASGEWLVRLEMGEKYVEATSLDSLEHLHQSDPQKARLIQELSAEPS